MNPERNVLMKIRSSSFHISLDGTAIVYLLWSLACIVHSTDINIDMMTGLEITTLVCAFILARALPNKAGIFHYATIAGVLQAIYVILQQCGITDSNHNIFKITGFMGNPGQLGGFQAISLISSLVSYRRCDRDVTKKMVAAAFVLILYSLLLSDSRSGFLAAIAGVMTMTYRSLLTLQKRQKRIWVIILCLACIFLWMMYLYRPESANARMLIWRVCINMFIDKPLFGFGAYGFNHHYMLYQEEYLRSHPNSMLAHMATDVAYPYNEFIHILLEQGLVGFFLFIFMIYRGLKECRNPMLCAPLVTLLTFSLFSYPSYKLALCVMLPLLLGILPTKPLICSTKANIATAFLSIITAISCILGSAFYERKLQSRISEVYNNPQEVISDINTSFIRNHNNLKINALYATLAKHFPEIISSSTIPLIFPSSENWCTIGNHFLMKNDYADAEKYFAQASRMTPNLIRPKYYLWKTYLKHGKKEDADRIAAEILHMQVKVENTYTLRIRNEILNYKQNKQE